VVQRKINTARDRLFDVPEGFRAIFAYQMGRPVESLSDAELVRAIDFAHATQELIKAEMWARVLAARLRRQEPAQKSPAEKPVVARRDGAPVP
jgi:hypothetical protein